MRHYVIIGGKPMPCYFLRMEGGSTAVIDLRNWKGEDLGIRSVPVNSVFGSYAEAKKECEYSYYDYTD